MIRGWISVGVLFVVVMALALWVVYRPRTADIEAHAISTLTPSQVTRIRFERTAPSGAPGHGGTSDPKQVGATLAGLPRTPGTWRVIEPVRAEIRYDRQGPMQAIPHEG